MIKTILITGANRGIGFEAARYFARKGHRVVLGCRTLVKAREAAEKMGGSALPLALDVTSYESVKAAAAQCKHDGTAFNVIINNAGICVDKRNRPNPENPFDTGLDDVRATLDLNLFGPYHVTQAFWPLLDRSKRVDIINVSSELGSLTNSGVAKPAYRMSKSGLNGFTRWLAAEVEGTSVFVNSICPGWVRTDMGGTKATRSLDEGIVGLRWLIEQEPDVRGRFVRDEGSELEF